MASLIAADREEWVIAHGQPKANNILITSNGPVMIDWDTVRLAPPTRDLWMTGGHQHCAELTARRLPPEELDFYRLCWDLADLCSYGFWFCGPHEAHTRHRTRVARCRRDLRASVRWRSGAALSQAERIPSSKSGDQFSKG
jgi:thiamine kinase-like enzyme